MGPISWTVSKTGSKQEVVDYVKQTLTDDGMHAHAKAYILAALEMHTAEQCSVSGSGSASSVSLSISSWTPTPAA